MSSCFIQCASKTRLGAVITLLSALLCSAEDIKPYRAEEVQPIGGPATGTYSRGQVAGQTATAAHSRLNVLDLKCASAKCELVPETDSNGPAIVIAGAGSGRAGARLLVITSDNRVVERKDFRVGSDGNFRATLAVLQLTPGAYKFGVITPDEKETVLAAGSFTLTAATPATPTGPTRGLKGILDRLSQAGSQTRSADPTTVQPGPGPSSVRSADSGSRSIFFGTFGLAIPGVVYSTDNYATNTRTTTVSSGVATKSAIRVNADGSYVWNSAWDGKIIRGQWRSDGGALILLAGQSGHDWRMERLPQPLGKAVVVLYDSSTSYHGTPLD